MNFTECKYQNNSSSYDFDAAKRYINLFPTVIFTQCPQTSLSFSQVSATTPNMRFSTQLFAAVAVMVASVVAVPPVERGDPHEISIPCTPGE